MARSGSGQPVKKLTLRGYKSIRSLDDFELNGINVLIGANGSGKTNFVSFFHLLHELVEQRLELAVNKAGGADKQLYLGPKVTSQIKASIEIGSSTYVFTLEPTIDDRLVFNDERVKREHGLPNVSDATNRGIGRNGQRESSLNAHIGAHARYMRVCKHIYRSISQWTVYHFHDTSETAAMRRYCSVGDYERLRPDAGNLAPFLMQLRENDNASYRLIVDAIKLVAPFFRDFTFRPKNHQGDEAVQLEWLQEETDYPFHPSQLSDGTLRFIALAAALLQPNPPATILIDEPELGLHPYALEVLGSLIRQAEERTQLIVSTQSAALVSTFDPEHVVVVERKEGETTFRRLENEPLASWLEDYSLGELWQKNVTGGGPVHEYGHRRG